MSILFLADVHLCSKKPKVVNGFLYFLNHQAIHAKALYILGDLFELWLGDDTQDPLHINVAKSLKFLNTKKIPCYFIHGNHDFLLGKKYADLCGMKLLPKKQILTLPSGKNIVILHGDILSQNKLYQRFQKILRNHTFQQLFLSLPLCIRSYIFNTINTYCIQHTQKKQFNINSQTVIHILTKSQSKIMIHGHTHQSTIHNIFYSKTIIFKRIVVGNWKEYGSIVEIDETNNNCTLMKFPLITTESINNTLQL